MSLQPGHKLGPYNIVARIGAGGMGEVYRAKDTRLERMVAIKVLGSLFTHRFEREARAIAALSHAHICTLYDIGPDYLVMEYIEGRPLQGKYRPEEAARLAIQMADALEEAHRKGIVHLDLKPANIMVTASGSVKLLDFGLARLVRTGDAEFTRSIEHTLAGTIGYMSPEQARCEPLDGRSDIFSFGVVLYEMLSGRRAFAGNSVAGALNAMLTDPPAAIDAPPLLERIVMKCLEKEAAQRFQTISEVQAALQAYAAGSSTQPASHQPSIAVLAFADMSPAHDNEYFCDGMAEEIINALTHVPGLKVIARTSAFAFKGKNEDIRRVANVLDVGHVLEGSVRRAGNRIRVTAQLINSCDGSHVWSERYDREMEDIFAMQDDIAASIAAVLELKLTPQPAASRHTPSLPAFEAYMMGVYQGFKATPESIARGWQTLREAAALDPAYAQPHSALGALTFMTAAWGLKPAHEAMPFIRDTALKALALDPNLSEAHALLGVVAGMYDYDWAEAGRRFALALDAPAVSNFARMFHANYYLLPLGRTREAVEQMERALETDPLNVLYRSLLGVCLHADGATGRASAELAKALEIEGNHWTVHMVASWNYMAAGMLEEARTAAEKTYQLAPWQPLVIGILAAMISRTADTQRTAQLLQKMRELPAHRQPVGMSMYHIVRAEPDAAIDWLEKAIEQRDVWAARFPRLRLPANLHSSPRWPALLRMMNLPESTESVLATAVIT